MNSVRVCSHAVGGELLVPSVWVEVFCWIECHTSYRLKTVCLKSLLEKHRGRDLRRPEYRSPVESTHSVVQTLLHERMPRYCSDHCVVYPVSLLVLYLKPNKALIFEQRIKRLKNLHISVKIQSAFSQ